jgi:hypothetical protein
MTALGGFCLGLSLGFVLSAPAIESREVAQLRAAVVLGLALAGLWLL